MSLLLRVSDENLKIFLFHPRNNEHKMLLSEYGDDEKYGTESLCVCVCCVFLDNFESSRSNSTGRRAQRLAPGRAGVQGAAPPGFDDPGPN